MASLPVLKIRVESATPGFVGTQSISLFDYNTRQWVQVASGSSTSGDGAMEATVTTSPGQYLSASRAMKARVHWSSGAGASARADEVVWMLKP